MHCTELGLLISSDEATDPLSQALEDVVCSMKPGEECELQISIDQTLASSELLRAVPPDCLVLYNIHLVSSVRAPEVWTLSDQERQKRASWHKARGTEQFKLDNTYGASLHYSKALKYVVSITREVLLSARGAEYQTLKKSLLLNLSACQLKLKQFANVAQNCTGILEEGANVKALYRRGQALVAMSDFDGAKRDFLEILKIEPNNTAVQKQLKELESKVRAHRDRYREALKGMFS